MDQGLYERGAVPNPSGTPLQSNIPKRRPQRDGRLRCSARIVGAMAAFPSEMPMKNLLVLLLFASSLFLRAQSLFEGTWEMKMDTLQFSGSPEDYLFADGMYHCKSCIPKVDVKTDGVD